MSISQDLTADFEREAVLTRKLLEVVPEDQLAWKPHEKSMSLAQLTGHIAEMPTWLGAVVDGDELDFESIMGDYKPFVPATRSELLEILEKNLQLIAPTLAGKDDAFLREEWIMRKGPKILLQSPRNQAIRDILLHHLAHHRGQLTVYLRLLDVPVPPTYGGTADVDTF